MPTNPVPSKPSVPGSGTVGGGPPGPVVAKQVAGLLTVPPHTIPITCTPLTVIPVEISALVRTKNSDDVLKPPLAVP